MQKIKSIYLVIIMIGALTILGAGCSSTITTSTENTNARIGIIAVPAEGNLGIFSDNIDTLALTEEDLPIAYAPYETNTYYKPEFINYTDSIYGNIKGYDPQKIRSTDTSSTGFTEDMILNTFEDTSIAVKYYNSTVAIAPIGNDDPNSFQSTFDDIGDGCYYITTQVINESNPDYNTTHWDVYIIKSNLVVSMQITTPTTFTETDLHALLNTWQQKTLDYQLAN